MKNTEISLKKTFEASHAVILPIGQEPRHSHLWNLAADFRHPEADADQKRVTVALDVVLSCLEGRHLNEISALKPYGASAESLVRHIFQQLERQLQLTPWTVELVEVEEEPGCRARYWRSETDRDIYE